MTDLLTNSGLFTKRWWVVFLRGVIAVIFGVMAFAWPHLTIATLVLLFGWYALIHGISSMIGAIAYRPEAGNRWLLALEGVVGIWAGIVTLRSPTTTAVVLIFFVWIWAIATGILRIAEAIRLRKCFARRPSHNVDRTTDQPFSPRQWLSRRHFSERLQRSLKPGCISHRSTDRPCGQWRHFRRRSIFGRRSPVDNHGSQECRWCRDNRRC